MQRGNIEYVDRVERRGSRSQLWRYRKKSDQKQKKSDQIKNISDNHIKKLRKNVIKS